MKRAKPLWQVSVATTPEAEDAVAEMLGGIFDLPASSYLDCEKRTSRATVFVTDKIRPDALRKLREGLNTIERCGIKIGPGKIFAGKVRREDWAESWKRHFKPIEIGGALLIKPEWNKKRRRPGQAVVILNPGLSFGTGQHPTTRFCLEEIVRNANREKRALAGARKIRASFFDIGTGSGILAIAAAKLGYQTVGALDFDPEAIRAARANARANKVKIKLFHRDAAKLPARPNKRFDLICANLISELLVKERRRLAAQLKPGGVLAVAGILKSEFSGVRRALEQLGLELIAAKSEKEWRSGSFCMAEIF